MKEDGVCGTADEQGWRFWYLVSPTATQPPPPITSSCCCMSLSPTQCHPAQTEHFIQVCITHSVPSCTDRAFHTGLYHPLNAILHRQSISHRSVSPTQLSLAQHRQKTVHAGLYHPLSAVLHRQSHPAQSISRMSVSPTQCGPAQTEHFTQVCITHSMPSCTDRAFHAGLYHPLIAILHRQSISCRSLSPTQCHPAQTEHFMQVFITHSMPSCTDRAFHAGLYHPLIAILHSKQFCH